MDFFRDKDQVHDGDRSSRPTKRISTPAGQRLSVILEAAHAKRSKSPAAINVTTTSTFCNDPTHNLAESTHSATKKQSAISLLSSSRLGTPPKECVENTSNNGSTLSVSVWSDRDPEKSGKAQKRRLGICCVSWSQRKIGTVIAIILAVVIAVAVGLAMGLKKETTSGSQSTPISGALSTGAATSSPVPTSTRMETDMPTMPSPTSNPSALPSGFPVGAYSFVTFLDTVITNCTSNTATWTCAPYTTYYDDQQKALVAMNWEISGSSGSYKISSNGQDAILGTSFQNERLELLDSGKSTERYRFLLSRTRTVNVTGTIGSETGSFQCDYGATTIQGSLYTRMAYTYPDERTSVGNLKSTMWPFAMRIEQSVAGGDNVPLCKKTTGAKVTDGLRAQDASTLCSCLYKNWTPKI